MINVCVKVDITIIQYLPQSPELTPNSIYTIHILAHSDSTHNHYDLAKDALSQSKPVVIQGGGRYLMFEELTMDFLDKSYAISLERAVWVYVVSYYLKQLINSTN